MIEVLDLKQENNGLDGRRASERRNLFAELNRLNHIKELIAKHK